MTGKEFAEKYNITIKSEYADVNPSDPEWKANHYLVTLKRKSSEATKLHTLKIYFSKGFGISGEPEMGEVLECLASDMQGLDDYSDFEEWASEYGYDTDSRKAERVYKQTLAQQDKLKKFMPGESVYNEFLEIRES